MKHDIIKQWFKFSPWNIDLDIYGASVVSLLSPSAIIEIFFVALLVKFLKTLKSDLSLSMKVLLALDSMKVVVIDVSLGAAEVFEEIRKATVFTEPEVEDRSDALDKLVFPLIWVDFSLLKVMFSTIGAVEKFADGKIASSKA